MNEECSSSCATEGADGDACGKPKGIVADSRCHRTASSGCSPTRLERRRVWLALPVTVT